jgi:hypothetical protein
MASSAYTSRLPTYQIKALFIISLILFILGCVGVVGHIFQPWMIFIAIVAAVAAVAIRIIIMVEEIRLEWKENRNLKSNSNESSEF